MLKDVLLGVVAFVSFVNIIAGLINMVASNPPAIFGLRGGGPHLFTAVARLLIGIDGLVWVFSVFNGNSLLSLVCVGILAVWFTVMGWVESATKRRTTSGGTQTSGSS